MNIIKAAIPLLSVLLLAVPARLVKSLNVRKDERYKQLRFPVLALLYTAALCVFFHYLSRLAALAAATEPAQKALLWLSPDGRLEYVTIVYAAIALNAAVLYVFFLVKGTARLRVRKKTMPKRLDDAKGLGRAYWSFADIFYDISGGTGCVRRGWVKAAYALRYAAAIMASAYIALLLFLQFPVFLRYSWVPYAFLSDCAQKLYLFPALSFVVINELKWFLDGREEITETTEIAVDKTDDRPVSDYSELVGLYRQQFPERFVGCKEINGTGQPVNFHNDINTANKLEAAIVNRLNAVGQAVNEGFMACVRQLALGRHALIDASIYSSFGEYLFIYLNTLLAGGENILFLCAEEEDTERISAYIAQMFTAINGFHPLWVIRGNADIRATTNADILVLTPQAILDENIAYSQSQFFDGFTTMVIVNAAEVIARDGAMLTVLAHRLSETVRRRGAMQKPRYVCLSESLPPETSTTLRQLLDLQEDLVRCDGYQTYDNTHLMLWNYESRNIRMDGPALPAGAGHVTWAQDNLFGDHDTHQYWGFALPLACVALKHGVRHISVMTKRGTPYVQIVNSMSGAMAYIQPYFDMPGDRVNLRERVVFNRLDGRAAHAAFIIVEDDLFNLPLAVRNYCRFGGKETTMLLIVSKPYMLRDYFAAHIDLYMDNEAQINMITPVLTDTERIVVTKILCEASVNGIEQAALLRRLADAAPGVGGVENALAYCRDIAFPGHEAEPLSRFFWFEYKTEYDPALVDYRQSTYIRLRRDTPLTRLVSNSRQACVEIRGQRHMLGIFSDRLHQRYIPGQPIVHKGMLYRIERIDAANGVLFVTEAADALTASTDYVQVREYALRGQPVSIERISVPFALPGGGAPVGYEAERLRAGVTVDTPAYYVLEAASPRLDLCGRDTPRLLSDEQRQAMRREYNAADIIALRIKGVGAERADKAAFLLAVILNELMKTVFPYSQECMAVCPVLADENAVCDSEMARKIALAYPRIHCGGFFAHDANDVEVLLIEDCASETGMMNTLLMDRQFPFRNLFSVILDYLRWMKAGDGGMASKYLCFGADAPPACFDFDALTQALSRFEIIRRQEPRPVTGLASKGQCSYCHRDLSGVEFREVDDNAGENNRKLCEACAKLIVTSKRELSALYKETRKYLCNTFDIKLPNVVRVRFASAERIRKRMKTGDQREVLGFANLDKNEIWVETHAPATNIMDVLAHELTHIWQAANIDMSDLAYIEGHASYVALQYLRHKNKKAFAARQEAALNGRNDEYGAGYRMVAAGMAKRGGDNSFNFMLEKFGLGDKG